MTLEIRAATLADAPAILRFLGDIQAERLDTITRRDPWTLETTTIWLRPRVEAERSFVLVAFSDGQVVAMLDVQGGARDHDRHIGKLGMSVARIWRGRGLGRAA